MFDPAPASRRIVALQYASIFQALNRQNQARPGQGRAQRPRQKSDLHFRKHSPITTAFSCFKRRALLVEFHL